MKRWIGDPIFLISLAWVGYLLSFMLVTPLYQAPDEHTHVDRVLDSSVAGFSEYDENRYSLDLIASARIWQLSMRPDIFAAGAAPERPQPNMADLSDSVEGTGINQLADHPPAYYGLMAAARVAVTSWLPQDFWQHDLEVLTLRFFNVLIIAPLPWVFARTASNLGVHRRATWAAAALPLCIPQLAHIGSSVNNDNLLLLASSVAIMCAARVLANGLDMKSGIWMAVAAGVALQTKIFGIMFWPFLGLVCLVAVVRRPRQWPAAVVVAGILALSSWTYIRNLVLYGEPYPRLKPASAPPDVPGFVVDYSEFLPVLAKNTSGSFFGRFGWLWLQLPQWWTTALAILSILALVLALLRPRLGQNVRIMLLPALLVGIMYMYTSHWAHARTGLFIGEQGRYLYPGLGALALAVAVAYGWTRPRWLLAVMSLIAAVGYAMSVRLLLVSFWEGEDLGRLQSLSAWSPLGGAGLALAALGAGLVVGGLLALQLRLANEPTQTAPETARHEEPSTVPH